MNAAELIARAETLCRYRRIPFPSDLRQYAHQWARERFDLERCWSLVRPLVSSGRPLWQAETEIRRHHDQLQRARDAEDRAAGDPSATTPAPAGERRWGSWAHRQAALPPASTGSILDDPDGLDDLPLCAEQAQTRPTARRQPYRRRTGTKAHKVREFLRAHVIRRGPIAVIKLERLAKNEGLLEEDQSISRSSTFRRVMRELNIESHRIGFGRGAEYVWRLKPPAWTRGLDVHA
jgi:hypothetical protein